MVRDPLGLERCARCGNAFRYDLHEEATATWREYGRSGFVCRWCAQPVLEAHKKAVAATLARAEELLRQHGARRLSELPPEVYDQLLGEARRASL